jgi:hypothetical protein
MTIEDLQASFKGLAFTEILSGTVTLKEGKYHQGLADIVRMTARK